MQSVPHGEKNSARKPTQNVRSNLTGDFDYEQNTANLTKESEVKFETTDSAASKFKTGAVSDRPIFDAADIDDALEKIFNEIEHQSAFWHATPFALVFLARIFMRAREAVKNGKDGKNDAAELIATRLGEFFSFMLMVCGDADKTHHAAPLKSFADMLAEKYLWPENDENDEELWEDRFYDDDFIFIRVWFWTLRAWILRRSSPCDSVLNLTP